MLHTCLREDGLWTLWSPCLRYLRNDKKMVVGSLGDGTVRQETPSLVFSCHWLDSEVTSNSEQISGCLIWAKFQRGPSPSNLNQFVRSESGTDNVKGAQLLGRPSLVNDGIMRASDVLAWEARSWTTARCQRRCGQRIAGGSLFVGWCQRRGSAARMWLVLMMH